MITTTLVISSLLIGLVIGVKLGGRTSDYIWVQASKGRNYIDIGGETYSVINVWEQEYRPYH